MTDTAPNPHSEKSFRVGRFECDVWRCCGVLPDALYTVFDRDTGRYVSGGRCADVERARQAAIACAQRLLAAGSAAP